MSIINFIEKFRKTNRILYTTPSHNQGKFITPEAKKLLGRKVFESDFSELEGFDNLAAPEGIIKEVQNYAKEVYDTKATFFLTNGSTSGILAAMYATLNRSDKVLIARNCHKSIYNALILTGAVPVWIMPEYNKKWGIFETIDTDVLSQTFETHKDIKVFILTSPTYEGVMSDIQRISYVCKRYKVKLIVDEAHGALWNFHKALGSPAILQGADIAVQSLHKTAGALNPSALLHVGKNSSVSPERIQDSLNLITTTSPSYPLLINIESTIRYLDSEKGRQHLSSLVKNVNRTIRNIKNIPNIEVYSNHNDITKILVKVSNMSGFELSEKLSKIYNIEDELANETSVLFLTGIGTNKAKLKKLEKALTDLCLKNIKITQDTICKQFTPTEPRIRYIPALIWNKEAKEVELKYALSRVCMEIIAPYPPGVPLLLPGEVIKKEHIEYLSDRKTIKVLL